MAHIPKWKKEQEKHKLPTNYSPTKEEDNAYHYCVENDIRISPIASDESGKWYIGVSTPDDFKKVYKSKYIYNRDTIWVSFYEMCLYYYKKRNNEK